MASAPKEGEIKPKTNLKLAPVLEEKQYIDIEKWRVIFFKMNLIGESPSNGVGFGNLSRRIKPNENEFIITGTQTGNLSNLTGSSYTKVVKCDITKLTIEAIGPIAPSSESITHYSIYESSPQINAVFHIHHQELWNYMKNNGHDKISKAIHYGTKEMAQACQALIKNNNQGLIVLEGHQEGIIAYGSSVEEAGKIILDTLKQSRK